MEERVPPAGDIENGAGEPPGHRSRTYIVQMPKDQIYRVPPPQNAIIVQSHRNPDHQKNYHCFWLLWLLLFIIILALIFGIIIGMFFLIVKPKSPQFSVKQVQVKNTQYNHHHPHHLEYDIALKVENPNKQMDILYLTGGGASLAFKEKQIANGKPPAFYQEHENSTVFQLVLAGSDAVLPQEIQRSMKGKDSKLDLSLSLMIPVRMKIGLIQTWNMKTVTACNVRVNTLGKGTRVLSHECKTKVV